MPATTQTAQTAEDAAVEAFALGQLHYTQSDEQGRLEMLRDARLGLAEMDRFADPTSLPAPTVIDAAYWGGVLVARQSA